MYDLAVEGYEALSRAMTALRRRVSRDPLVGIADGTNTVFLANYYPISTADPLTVYVGGSAVSGVADYDTGEIVLASPPASQPLASYVFVPYTTRQILDFCIDGFHQMEALWPRGYTLVNSSGSPVWFSFASQNFYVVDSSGSSPMCNGIPFHLSVAQVGFLNSCIVFRHLLSRLGDTSLMDWDYRESKGAAISKSRRPSNIESALEQARRAMNDALQAAQEQYYGDGMYGGVIHSPASEYYATHLYWQANSVELPYSVARRVIR